MSFADRVLLPTDEVVRLQWENAATTAQELVRSLDDYLSFLSSWASAKKSDAAVVPSGSLLVIRTQKRLQLKDTVEDHLLPHDVLAYDVELPFDENSSMINVIHVASAPNHRSTAPTNWHRRSGHGEHHVNQMNKEDEIRRLESLEPVVDITEQQQNGSRQSSFCEVEESLGSFDVERCVEKEQVDSTALMESMVNLAPGSSTGQELEPLNRIQQQQFHLLLYAGLQFIDRLLLLQSQVQRLFFELRDAKSTSGLDKVNDFLPSVWAMLCVTEEVDPWVATFSRASRSRKRSPEPPRERVNMTLNVKTWLLCDSSFTSIGGIYIEKQGWMECGEWGAFWRSKRKQYVCLWNSSLLFFASKSHSDEYFFEQARQRRGLATEAGRKRCRENSPQHAIELQGGWKLRRAASDLKDRHAFAFFDDKGRIRMILDVDNAQQASEWVGLISKEIHLNELYAKLTKLQADSRSNGGARLEELVQLIGCSRFLIPLRWLHAQIDRNHLQACIQRMKSTTIGQALKDLQRDSVRINGKLYSGTCVEEIISALAMEILSHESDDDDYDMNEMSALRFARRLIICSSRTHGGGDILDAINLMLCSDRFCICPDSNTMDPVEIHIKKTRRDNAVVAVAQIAMKMTYRVVSMRDEEEEDGDKDHQNLDQDDVHQQQEAATDEDEQAPPHEQLARLIGTFHQEIVCTQRNWLELHGDVGIELTLSNPHLT